MTTEIKYLRVCISLHNTYSWRHKWYVCMSVFMCRIRAGADGNNMPTCLHLCAQYFQVTTDIVCAQVCIYVRNTNWWRQKWYVCISVFMCTILAGDDRNNMSACLYLCVQCLLGTTEIIYMSACVYFCAQYLMVTTEIMSACLYLCVGYVLVTTEIICLHVCIYVYNTCWWRQK